MVSVRLASWQHDWVSEELEGNGAEERLWSPGLQRRCIKIPLSKAANACIASNIPPS